MSAPASLDHWKTMLEYEKAAAQRCLEALSTSPEGEHTRKAIDLFAHIQQARRAWIIRLKGTPAVPAGFVFFPTNWTLADCRREAEEMDREWSALLNSPDHPGLNGHFIFRDSKGGEYKVLVHHALVHVFNHSTHHRGQVASYIRQAGGTPPAMDYVIFHRTPNAR